MFCQRRSSRYLLAGIENGGSENDPSVHRALGQFTKKPGTITRYVATIARVHIAAGPLSATRVNRSPWRS
jgi:hypothetical protein